MQYHRRFRVPRHPSAPPGDFRLTGPLPVNPRDRRIHIAGREAIRRSRNGMDPNLKIRLAAGVEPGETPEMTKALTSLADAIDRAQRLVAATRNPRRRSSVPPTAAAPARAPCPIPGAPRRLAPSAAPAIRCRPHSGEPPWLARWTFQQHVEAAHAAGPVDLDELFAAALCMGAPSRSEAADWLERGLTSAERHASRRPA